MTNWYIENDIENVLKVEKIIESKSPSFSDDELELRGIEDTLRPLFEKCLEGLEKELEAKYGNMYEIRYMYGDLEVSYKDEEG